MTLLFDLDGTLLDSTELLLGGYKHTARTHLGRETPDEEWLELLGIPSGLPADELVREATDALRKRVRDLEKAARDTILLEAGSAIAMFAQRLRE